MLCPNCKTDKNVIKRGTRKNKYVKKQIYWCKSCEKYFVEHDGFEHMSYPKEIIVKVLHLFVEGLSLSKIRNYIYQHEGYYLYDGTILYWVKKYAKLLKKFERKLKPKIKGRIHSDEVVVKVRKKKCYDINSIDSKTKYNLERTLTEKRDKKSFRKHFNKLREKIYDQALERYHNEKVKPVKARKLLTFVTDELEQYLDAFNKYFYRVAKLVHGVPIACKKYGLKYNNNSIERHNEDIKQRCKVTRGFDTNDSGDAFLELRRIVYNFVRPHMGLEHTPAEEAEIHLELGRNKFLGLIKFFLPFEERAFFPFSIEYEQPFLSVRCEF